MITYKYNIYNIYLSSLLQHFFNNFSLIRITAGIGHCRKCPGGTLSLYKIPV